MNSARRIILWILAIALSLTLSIRATSYLLRERWEHDRQVILADGSSLQVHQSGSQKRYFGHPHVFGFGGGDRRGKLEFSQGGKMIIWEGSFTPILLQFDSGVPVLALFDRESNYDKWKFRHLRWENGWQELPVKQLSRKIALQNLWLDAEDYEIVRRCDPEEFWFRRSLMAQLWRCIATGDSYEKVSREDISAEFLREFKASMRR